MFHKQGFWRYISIIHVVSCLDHWKFPPSGTLVEGPPDMLICTEHFEWETDSYLVPRKPLVFRIIPVETVSGVSFKLTHRQLSARLPAVSSLLTSSSCLPLTLLAIVLERDLVSLFARRACSIVWTHLYPLLLPPHSIQEHPQVCGDSRRPSTVPYPNTHGNSLTLSSINALLHNYLSIS